MGVSQAVEKESKHLGNDCGQKPYFEYGNVRIIISEHFSENGETMEKLLENAVLRDGRLRTGNNPADI